MGTRGRNPTLEFSYGLQHLIKEELMMIGVDETVVTTRDKVQAHPMRRHIDMASWAHEGPEIGVIRSQRTSKLTLRR